MGPPPTLKRADAPVLTFRTGSAPPRRRGVLGGLVVFAIGLAFFVQALRIPNSGPLLFIALGAAFAAAYGFGYRQFVYLIPAAILLGVGVGFVLSGLVDPSLATAVFFGALAAAFVAVTVLAPDHRWPLVPAVPLALVALAGVVGKVDVVPAGIQPFIFPVILMAVGGYLLIEPAQR